MATKPPEKPKVTASHNFCFETGSGLFRKMNENISVKVKVEAVRNKKSNAAALKTNN